MFHLKSDQRPYLFIAYFGLLTLSLFDVTTSFSSGSVRLACSTRSPLHFPFSAQNSPPPFGISATRNNRGSLYVTVYGLGNDVSFKGIMMQATVNGQNSGQFISVPPEAQILDCGYPGGAVSHKSAIDKKAVTVEWTSLGYSGDITFSATVVQSYSRYWTNIAKSYTIDSVQE